MLSKNRNILPMNIMKGGALKFVMESEPSG